MGDHYTVRCPYCQMPETQCECKRRGLRNSLEGYGGHYGYPGPEEAREERLKDQLMDIIRREEAEGRAAPSPLAKGANEKQHGGSHYRESMGMQHWDFVHALGLNYFQGNATKYVSRWRRKNGVEDLQKGSHYCEKARELGYEDSPTRRALREDWMEILFQFCADNRLNNDEYCILRDIILDAWTPAQVAVDILIKMHTPHIDKDVTRLGD